MNEAEAQMRCDMYNRAHNTNLTLAEYGQLDLDQLKKSDAESNKRMSEVSTTTSYDKNVNRKLMGK